MKRLTAFVVGALFCLNSAVAAEKAWPGKISDRNSRRPHKSRRTESRLRRRSTGNPLAERVGFDIDSMPAGLAMDQLVAQEVMGEPLDIEAHSSWWVNGERGLNLPWSPSTQDSAAYGVIAAVWTRFGLNFSHREDQTCHIAYFASSPKNEPVPKATGRAETFALAVCRAALKAARSG